MAYVALAVLFLFSLFLGTMLSDVTGAAKNQTDKRSRVEALISAIKTDYGSDFFNIDNDTNDDFEGFYNLQDYCRSRSLICRDQRGPWRWEITIYEEPLFRYRVIKIYDADGDELGEVSGAPYWGKYMMHVDYTIGSVCGLLLDYWKGMSNMAGADLNWYAENGPGCTYDGGVDSVTVGSAVVKKQISCAADWTPATSLGLDQIVGGLWKLRTGTIEIKNGNSIYTNECASSGLDGTKPPYAVALRVWVLKGYYQVCCGY